MSSAARQRELMTQLTGMGFDRIHIQRAMRRIDVTNDNAAEMCIEWMTDHPMNNATNITSGRSGGATTTATDDEKKRPSSASTNSTASTASTAGTATADSDENIAMITMMGFTVEEARQALKQKRSNVEQAIFWLLERKKEKQEYKLEEIKKREAEEMKIMEKKKQLRSSDSPYVHYGDTIALRSLKNSRYLSVATAEPTTTTTNTKTTTPSSPSQQQRQGSIHATSSSINPQCLFVIQNADDEYDKSPVVGKSKVILAYVKGTRIGIEADGSTNANRTGPIDPFMTWRVWDAKNEHSTSAILGTGHIYLESAVHNFLQPADDSIVGARSPTKKFAKWAVLVQQIPKTDAPSSPHGSGPSSTTPVVPMVYSPEARWERLQKTYRLAALRIRKVQVEQYRQDIDKQRVAMTRRLKEDRSCVVCLDKPPNTVILECGHMCACSSCGRGLEFCPICRDKITRLVIIRK